MHICCIYTYIYIFYFTLYTSISFIPVFYVIFYFIFYSCVFSLLELLLWRQISPWGLIKYISISLSWHYKHSCWRDVTRRRAVSPADGLPPRVLLTITKLQCMLESKQERIAALERQVDDLMQDRKFLRSQIENLTCNRVLPTFASPSPLTEGRRPASGPRSTRLNRTLLFHARVCCCCCCCCCLSRSAQSHQGAALGEQVPEEGEAVLLLLGRQRQRLRGVAVLRGVGGLERTPEEETPQGQEEVQEGAGLQQEERWDACLCMIHVPGLLFTIITSSTYRKDAWTRRPAYYLLCWHWVHLLQKVANMVT